MTLKFRHKIFLLSALAFVALGALTGVALIMGRSSELELARVETRYLPLLELDRDVKRLYARIPRALEDAVNASDEPLLRDADAARDDLVARLDAGARTIDDNGGDSTALRAELQGYYTLAREVSLGLIRQHSGEDFAARIEEMRAAQQRFAGHLDAATTPDHTRMAAAFEAARAAQRTALRLDVLVALAGFGLMLALSWRIIRGTVRSLNAIAGGIKRFARGDVATEIVVETRDELGDLAREANETGARLREYRVQSEREDWIKTGVAGLATEIAGEADASVLGRKALTFLARYSGAALGAAYAADEGLGATLLDVYAFATRGPVPTKFRPGQGIVGQAVKDNQLRVISDVPADYVSVRSALGEATPRHLVVVPFGREGRTLGVIELGFVNEVSERALELFGRTREVLGVVFDVAESRNRVQTLLEETQRQAEELKVAYDLTEARNQALEESERRLQQQGEELRQTNEELEGQAAALDAERTIVVAQNEALLGAQALLEERAKEVARVSGYKSQFLANMSHELRTPLNSIMILSKLLAESSNENLTEKQIEFARLIHTSGQELLTLINDVLDLAKVESGRDQLVFEVMPPADVVAYVRSMFEPVATQKGLDLGVTIADGLPPSLRTDRHRLQQVLKNLLSNAIKFTQKGRVDVTVGRPGPGVALPAGLAADAAIVIEVADTGIGIPRDKQALIFEAFAQADGGTSRKYGGTGLGLSIAKQIVLRLGGVLQVRSELGVGTTFSVVLPIAGPTEPAPAPAAAPATAPPAAPVAPATGDEKAPAADGPALLIIEDDPIFAEIVLGLVRDAGFVGLVAATGNEGLALAERRRPSAIILDLGLPDIDGWSVMDQLKASRTTRDIPVHVMSAFEGADQARRMGAVGYLRKPISAEEIRSAIETLARSVQAPLRSILAVGGDGGLQEALSALAREGAVHVEHVATAAGARELLQSVGFGCLVIDSRVRGARRGARAHRRHARRAAHLGAADHPLDRPGPIGARARRARARPA